MNGVIPLFKPKGMTSAGCVYQLRKILHERRIGHTGTLDPDVDGVLPICVGQATKLVNRIQASGKIYQGEITLGFATTTEDLSGEEIERIALTAAPSEQTVDDCLAQFVGAVTQIPPMFSAVKVNGKRLYEYARAGETIERPSRQIQVDYFARTSPVIYQAVSQTATFTFEVGCSKGTYVRTLATDVGRKLAIPAVMSNLRRLKSGGITLDQTVTLTEIETAMANNSLEKVIRPIETVLADLPNLDLSPEQWEKVQNGGAITAALTASEITLSYQNHIKAIYQSKKTRLGNYVPATMMLTND
ncbi:tRNA pseudouridine(55) synthase TruB [Lapidilactobacillus bayanensis]|uniref:tRNA pseudouridine(55) synthase TruB n=1 Tax=Lapidilactobacillus bayanensis TaxID=2485998 RepID=UPI000F785762|nr:tRNA pseudouridine(55) synthase TruB [Lapidilactobacillus bayanensis]